MINKLELIAQRARTNKNVRFTSLMHYINEAYLTECFYKLKKGKASGIDKITLVDYEANLNENIIHLVKRLKSKLYKPKPVRRTYIPKAGKGAVRPLGIPTVEDKMVQMALKGILESIHEQDFKDCSHGFRPNRSCHTAIKQLNVSVMKRATEWIVEVDIKKFFDTVQHEWLMKFLEKRIADTNILWLVGKFLNAGIMEEGRLYQSEIGTPQGGVISPLLANIYLHYVLDLWFEVIFQTESKGRVELIRYCDDFVIVCERWHDAQRFLPELTTRLAKFGLEISQEKTRTLKFGKVAWKQAQRTGKKMETFDFLGFTHYCGKSRKGHFMMVHKTAGKNLSRKLTSTNDWLRKIRSAVGFDEIWPVIRAKLIGHYNYFGINGNIRALQKFYKEFVRMTYKWINRRSQKKSFNWKQFTKALKWANLPKPRICHDIWN